MIPLYKLDKLPHTQKLRKIAKTFSMAENRLIRAAEKTIDIFSTAEILFFTDAARLLAGDILFSHDAHKLFREAAVVFEQALTHNSDKTSTAAHLIGKPQTINVLEFQRALNSIKHILLAKTGRDQADWDFTSSDGRLDPAGRQIFEGVFVYFEDIRSPFNVGAMFRAAESFGVEKIFLSSFCADPYHRRSLRTAMGCIDIIPWERRDFFSPPEHSTKPQNVAAISELSCPIFALETGGTPIADFSFPHQGLLIVGSEELGVSPRALAAADASLGRVSIPSYGVKASLNVSVAFGIALHNWAQVNAQRSCEYENSPNVPAQAKFP